MVANLLHSQTHAYGFLLFLFTVVVFLLWLDVKKEEAYNIYVLENSKAHERYLVCYYNFNGTDLTPDLIDTSLCTHIIASFAGIDAKNFSVYLSDDQLTVLERFADVTRKKDVQRMISVGGAGISNFGPMVTNHANRKLFIKSLIELLKRFGLDGVDIDWEWPVIDGGVKQKVQFIQLLQEIQTEFQRHKKKYTLSAAVGAAESIVSAAYYVQHIAEHVDFVNLMTYDYHFFTRLFPITDYNSPLYADPSDENGALGTFNVNYSVNLWLSLGMPAKKMVLGLPTFGHTYRLRNSASHGRRAPAQGFGLGNEGFIDYSQLCQFIESSPFVTVVRDDSAKVPYAYDTQNWVSYDDSISLTEKVFYAKRRDVLGVMVYSLNADDYSGKCLGNSKFPLLNAVKYALLASA